MNLEGRVGLKQPGRGFLIRRHNAVAPASAASLYRHHYIASEEEHPYDALQSINQWNTIQCIDAPTVTILGQQIIRRSPP